MFGEVDIKKNTLAPAYKYSAFVFVSGILIGTRMYFGHFELLPTNTGLDASSELKLINEFFENGQVDVLFKHDEEQSKYFRQSSPVCVVHFPFITAQSSSDVVEYCDEQTKVILLALALSRGASGHIFNIVTLCPQLTEAKSYDPPSIYRGNLLTGALSGEDPESIGRYQVGIQSSQMNRLLAGLYKEVRQEESFDFQYFRFWQILETIADSQNYPSERELIDFEGRVMMDAEQKPRLVKGARNIVFSLLREYKIGDTKSTWENVNIWKAFRDTVAHTGSIFRYEELDNRETKKWAKYGCDEIASSQGHHARLDGIKWQVEHMLRKTISSSEKDQPIEALRSNA